MNVTSEDTVESLLTKLGENVDAIRSEDGLNVVLPSGEVLNILSSGSEHFVGTMHDGVRIRAGLDDVAEFIIEWRQGE